MSIDKERFALGLGSGRNRGGGMVRVDETDWERTGEEDATLSRRDRQQARSFAVGGHWSKRVPNKCSSQSEWGATRGG